MFSPLEQGVTTLISQALGWLYLASNSYALIVSLVAGLLLPSVIWDRPSDRKSAIENARYKLIAISFLLTITLSILPPFTLYPFMNWIADYRGYQPKNLPLSPSLPWRTLIFILGTISHVYCRRLVTPKLNELRAKITKKTKLARNERTDVRTVRELLPMTEMYNPNDYIDLNKGIFIGLNENKQPQYIPVTDWQKQHADIIGTTGAGKGVASGILLSQSIMCGEGVFVCDPKNDEWAPHLYRQVCEENGKPFYLIDLNKPEYQLDLLADINADQLEELLVAGFSLAEKGDIADFYRIADRRAARICAQDISQFKTIRQLFGSDYVQSINEQVPAFHGKMEELALLNSINASNGLSLTEIFDHGGCCYIIGNMRNGKVISAQRMILVRLLQIAETRDRIKSKPRPIAIFLDELKYHLSRPAMEGLGAARDKGVHIIMAHQSLADLKDCPADLNGDSVVGAVVENTKFKLVYKLQDPETAEWVAKMSGSILVDDETRKVESNDVFVEEMSDDRTIRQAERYFIDSNMLLNLPEFVCFVYTKDLPKPSLISPIPTTKKELIIHSVTSLDIDDINTMNENLISLSDTDGFSQL